MSRMQQRGPEGRMKEERDQEAPPPSRGNTVTAQGENQAAKPRMPHERDESSDSQQADNPSARRMGDLAHDAVEQGQQDTSKGQELDATYHRTRSDAQRPGGKK